MKKCIYSLLFIITFIIGIKMNSYAATGEIKYEAKYKDAISYTVTITGLEGKEEEYDYKAMICQEQDITAEKFFAALGKAFPIHYNKDTKDWKGSTLTALDGVKKYDTFERKGQYYAYVARVPKNGTNYEIMDGPTKIATPQLPALGSRIKIDCMETTTNYYFGVNALNTMMHNGVQRTVHFYVGEVTDQALLEKLHTQGTKAYEELLQYAKKQEVNLKKDSFQDTKTRILDYNIVRNYPIENGKYYFLHAILDNENGTYVDIEDIGIYNGKVNKQSDNVWLEKFKYEKPNEDSTIPEQQPQKNVTIEDNTKSNQILPKAGTTVVGMIVIVLSVGIMILLYRKNKEYKDIK